MLHTLVTIALFAASAALLFAAPYFETHTSRKDQP